MDIEKADQLYRELKKSDEGARRKQGLGFGTAAAPAAAPRAQPAIPPPVDIPTNPRRGRQDEEQLVEWRLDDGTKISKPSQCAADKEAPSVPATAVGASVPGEPTSTRERGSRDAERSGRRQRGSVSPSDRRAAHRGRIGSPDRGERSPSRRQGRTNGGGGTSVRQLRDRRPASVPRDEVGAGDRWTGEVPETRVRGVSPQGVHSSLGRGRDRGSPRRRSRSVDRRRSGSRDRHGRQLRERERRDPSPRKPHRRDPSPRDSRRRDLSSRDSPRRKQSPRDSYRREASYGDHRRQASSPRDSRRRNPSPRDSQRRHSPSQERRRQSGSPVRREIQRSRDAELARNDRHRGSSPRRRSRSRSPWRRPRSRSRGGEQRGERGRHGSPGGRGGDLREGSGGGRRVEANGHVRHTEGDGCRAPVEKPDFFALIEGFDNMAPAQKLKAQTKYMLQSHTTRARDTAGGQWTRLDLNSDALLDEEGAVPDMQFEELSGGAGPPTIASRRLAMHDASHEVRFQDGGASPSQLADLHKDAIFGRTVQGSGGGTAAGLSAPRLLREKLQGPAENSGSDSDDAPVVVELPEQLEVVAAVGTENPEAALATAPKLSWREKAALLRQQREAEAL